jgi:2-haloacid dehalogenase
LRTVTASEISTATAATTHAKLANKAIAFDGFPIFDQRSIFAMNGQLLPGRGAQLSNVGAKPTIRIRMAARRRTKMLDFSAIDDAFVFAGKSLDLEMTNEKRRGL